MRNRAVTYLRRHPFKGTCMLAVALMTALLLASHSVNVARWQLYAYRFEKAAEASPSGSPRAHQWPVRFEGGLFRVRVHVYPSELESARAINTAWVFGSSGSVRARYVRSLVITQSRSRLVQELSREMSSIRKRLELNDDEYLDLLARSVQAIPYGTINDEIGMPAEVVAGGRGTCSEKSVLLGALMLHEGYDTALFVLDKHKHVALGVRTDGPSYRDLPYAFVETTEIAPIGAVKANYLGWGPVLRPPQTIELGGTKRYRGRAAHAEEPSAKPG